MKIFIFSLFLICAHATVSFKTGKIQISKTILNIELAETPEQHEQGLMFRKKLEDGKGMLFIFSDTSERRFWMKNTFLPLSIAFFDDQKKIINILDMKPADSEMQTDFPTYDSAGPAKYALEVPVGWFQKHKIKSGDKFEFISTTNKTNHK
jgi:uncharacterized membrane protein (UPF0127 family)